MSNTEPITISYRGNDAKSIAEEYRRDLQGQLSLATGHLVELAPTGPVLGFGEIVLTAIMTAALEAVLERVIALLVKRVRDHNSEARVMFIVKQHIGDIGFGFPITGQADPAVLVRAILSQVASKTSKPCCRTRRRRKKGVAPKS